MAWHAVADEGDAVRDIATVIGRRLGVPVQPVPEENVGPFGPISRWTSQSLDMPPAREDDAHDDSVMSSTFMADLTAAMLAPIRDDGDAQAVVPIVLRGSPDDLGLRSVRSGRT